MRKKFNFFFFKRQKKLKEAILQPFHKSKLNFLQNL